MLRRFPAVLCGRISGCQWFRQIGFGCQSSCGDFARPVSGGLPPCGGFRRSIVLLRFPPARFCRPVSGCQLSCGGFCTGFLAADRLCSDFCPPDFGCMASGACRIASAGPLWPLRFRCARGSRLRFPVFGPSCTRIPAVNSAGCRKRCCLINLERYGRFPTQSLHYGGPDAQLHPDGRTAFHLAARRQQTHRRVVIPI